MSLSLRSLSDKDILSRIQQLTRRERSLTLAVLLHLNEIERRRLHLKLGYSSMFDYCTAGLGYSASAAARRIRTARCVARFPEVYDLLKTNEVNVSTVSQVSRILNGQNKDAILARIRGKSQREVEVVLAEFQPSITMPRDVVRPIMVRVPAVQDGGQSTAMAEKSTGQESAPVDACEKSAYCRSGSASVPQADPPAPGATGPAGFERRALIQFSASGAFMAKLEQIRSLTWHRLPANASLEQVFELLMDRFIEREDPSVRHERRDKQACQVPVSECETTPPAVLQKMPLRTDSTNRARYIPARVRDQVFARDRCQCTYTGTNGRRCASTRALQIDHVQPVARGGSCEANNLRLLCAYHNRLEAERLMGRHGGREGPRMR